jgi:hypothetical protein
MVDVRVAHPQWFHLYPPVLLLAGDQPGKYPVTTCAAPSQTHREPKATLTVGDQAGRYAPSQGNGSILDYTLQDHCPGSIYRVHQHLYSTDIWHICKHCAPDHSFLGANRHLSKYSFFESFPIVYIGTYGFSIGLMGVIFVSLIIACAIGAATYLLLVWFIYEPYTMKAGIGVPEHRLLPGVFAAALAPCGLFIFAWTARKDIHWIVPTIGIVIFSACVFVVSPPPSWFTHTLKVEHKTYL